MDGVPIVVDSGTFAYTFDVAARNLFRSTRAHNTVVVDGQEIHPIESGRVFELRSFARHTLESIELEGETLQFVASHDGYRRLSDSVVHRRRFELAIATDVVTVKDEIVGAGTHEIQSLVHLSSGTSVRRANDSSFQIEAAGAHAKLSLYGVEGGDVQIQRGWVSDRYGVRQDAPVLALRKRGRTPIVFGYVIAPVASASAERKRSRLTSQE